MKIPGLIDEVTRDWRLEPGLDAAQRLGLAWVELRAADGRWLHDMEAGAFQDVVQRVRRGCANRA